MRLAVAWPLDEEGVLVQAGVYICMSMHAFMCICICMCICLAA